MDFRRYAVYSGVGAVLWGTGVTLLGYFLGQIELVREHIELMLIAIVAISVLPVVFEVVRARLAGTTRRWRRPRPTSCARRSRTRTRSAGEPGAGAPAGEPARALSPGDCSSRRLGRLPGRYAPHP
jgi:hypothetical protein